MNADKTAFYLGIIITIALFGFIIMGCDDVAPKNKQSTDLVEMEIFTDNRILHSTAKKSTVIHNSYGVSWVDADGNEHCLLSGYLIKGKQK